MAAEVGAACIISKLQLLRETDLSPFADNTKAAVFADHTKAAAHQPFLHPPNEKK